MKVLPPKVPVMAREEEEEEGSEDEEEAEVEEGGTVPVGAAVERGASAEVEGAGPGTLTVEVVEREVPARTEAGVVTDVDEGRTGGAAELRMRALMTLSSCSPESMKLEVEKSALWGILRLVIPLESFLLGTAYMKWLSVSYITALRVAWRGEKWKVSTGSGLARLGSVER